MWAQADVQCLLRDAHRIVRSTCLDGAPWSQNNEIVSNHCSILSLEGICAHKFHSGMSPSVNFWTFVASSSWQRFSRKFAGVWNWAQHMALERSCVHLAGMLSPPGQSLEQFLHKTHFQPSGARPISGVARKVGSAMQPVRRAVPQPIPEGLGTHFHLAVARDIEHPFLRPPTTRSPVVYAARYALQSERDCIAQRLDVAETLQELADSLFEENLHAFAFGGPFPSSSGGKANSSRNALSVRCDFLDGPKTDCRFVLWTAPAWVGHAGSSSAVARGASRVSN